METLDQRSGSAVGFKLNSDNQCLFSLSNDTNTNIIVAAGVLTAGATLDIVRYQG
jgi:hypothetical protein